MRVYTVRVGQLRLSLGIFFESNFIKSCQLIPFRQILTIIMERADDQHLSDEKIVDLTADSAIMCDFLWRSNRLNYAKGCFVDPLQVARENMQQIGEHE